MTTQPALFISHGAPSILNDNSETSRFLQSYGQHLLTAHRPDAILIMSAHNAHDQLTLSAHERQKAIYDFYGFDSSLYKIRYETVGHPLIAQQVLDLLLNHNVVSTLSNNQDMDHGSWIPLKLMLGDDKIPIIQISVTPSQTSQYHYKIGQAISRVRHNNVLVIGSGSLTHNLSLFASNITRPKATPPREVTCFTNWVAEKFVENDTYAILNADTKAPYINFNHPSPEHLLPLFFAMGAGGKNAKARRIFKGYTYGALAMDMYRFGD